MQVPKRAAEISKKLVTAQHTSFPDRQEKKQKGPVDKTEIDSNKS